jgi:hypothetical protein
MTARRRKLSRIEKDGIIDRQGGKCPGLPHLRIQCGKPVTRDTCVFDHVEQRVFTKSDEPDEFQALCRGTGPKDRTSCNYIKTNGLPGAGSAGSDAHKRRKIRKVRHARAVHNYKMAAKAAGLAFAARLYPEVHRLMQRPRPRVRFAQAHRPLRSRNNLRRAKR